MAKGRKELEENLDPQKAKLLDLMGRALASNGEEKDIVVKQGSELETKLFSYINQLRSKYTEYQDRVSVWATSYGLGDTICVTPTIRKLRQLYPQNKMDVYSFHPEVFKYNKNVDASYLLDEKLELGGGFPELRLAGYKHSFMTFDSYQYKSNLDHSLMDSIDYSSQIALKTKLEDQEKWLELPASKTDAISLENKISPFDIDFDRAVVIHPSRTWASRTWPSKNWQALTNELVSNGCRVIAVGKRFLDNKNRLKLPGEANMGMQDCPAGTLNLIDQLSLLETRCLLDKCKCLITVDSGLLHIGLATDIRIVGMFTVVKPESRKAWRKNGFGYRFVAVGPTINCTQCIQDHHKTDCSFGEVPKCIASVEQVLDAFEKLMKT